MSVKAEAWAWQISGLSAYEKLVLLCLCHYAGDKAFDCWPSKEHIAEVVGCSKRKVDTCIKALVKRDLITVIHRNTGSNDLSNVYVMHLQVGR